MLVCGRMYGGHKNLLQLLELIHTQKHIYNINFICLHFHRNECRTAGKLRKKKPIESIWYGVVQRAQRRFDRAEC